MGKPRDTTLAQIKELNRAADLGPPEVMSLASGELQLCVPVNGLVLPEIEAPQ
jgi:hypothetical protein